MTIVRYFGVFGADQAPTAFYADDVWQADAIPADAVELTEAQWREFIENPGRRRWSANGPVPFTPPPVPMRVSVSRAQAKIALHRSGLLNDVRDAVISVGGEAQIWFDEALTWESDNPYVAQLGAAVGLSPPDIEALFAAASEIAA